MRYRAPRLQAHITAFALLVGSSATPAPAPAPAPAATPEYQVESRWTLAGEGGWDYVTVEPGRGRLYLTRGDRVEVLNTITGRVFHTIGGTSGVHAVVLAQELGRGYTTNGRSNSITMFDLASLAIVREK